jgi:CO dehydrogenase maturation factor
VLRKYIDVLADNYPYVVMDNEAGMEHLSRRTSQGADVLLICSDPTVRGVQTAGRIAAMAREEDMNVGRMFLVIGRVPEGGGALSQPAQDAIAKTGLELIGTVPYDAAIENVDIEGGSFVDLPEDSPALVAAAGILAKIT